MVDPLGRALEGAPPLITLAVGAGSFRPSGEHAGLVAEYLASFVASHQGRATGDLHELRASLLGALQAVVPLLQGPLEVSLALQGPDVAVQLRVPGGAGAAPPDLRHLGCDSHAEDDALYVLLRHSGVGRPL